MRDSNATHTPTRGGKRKSVTLMSTSSVKEAVKKAKEAAERKEWKEAKRWAAVALKQDRANYGACVLYGLAAANLAGEEEGGAAQAEAAYRKATQLDPENPLAWKGLAELLAKDAVGRAAELADALGKLARLVPAKEAEFAVRCADVLRASGNATTTARALACLGDVVRSGKVRAQLGARAEAEAIVKIAVWTEEIAEAERASLGPKGCAKSVEYSAAEALLMRADVDEAFRAAARLVDVPEAVPFRVKLV
jgi:hypothetical protein